MKHNGRFAQGVPCWADLMTSDVPAALRFYSALLGWDYVEGTEESGFYTMAVIDGATVAGAGSLPPGAEQPPAWAVYLAVDSADEAVERARAAGGSIVSEPMDVRTPEFMGRMAMIAEPGGSVLGVWQAGEHTGFGAVQEVGAVVWVECMSRDAQATRGFLAEVFGCTFTAVGQDAGLDYEVGAIDDQQALGVMAMDDGFPPDVPSYWMPTFAVADADAAAAHLRDSGGTVLMGPEPTPSGRVVVGADPQGAVVGLLELSAGAAPDSGQ